MTQEEENIGASPLKREGEGIQEASPKRARMGHSNGDTPANGVNSVPADERQKGVAPVKKEYIIDSKASTKTQASIDDDAAEAAPHVEQEEAKGSKKKNRGQNKARKYGKWSEEVQLCASRSVFPEFSPRECKFGDKCRFEHNLRKYLQQKREDLTTLGGVCPIWELRGTCNVGWKCRFVKSHSKEVDHEHGRKELVLCDDEERKAKAEAAGIANDDMGVVNIVSSDSKHALSRKRFQTPKSDKYTTYLNQLTQQETKDPKGNTNGKAAEEDEGKVKLEENRASYIEPPLLPSEKRRIYYGPETPVLAPLTTQGNLPFRRLCVSLGAQVTWSEMAMGLPLIQGEKSEWALMKAHTDELSPPSFSPAAPGSVVSEYDNKKDSKFGVQIAANKPWLALKTTEVLTALCPHLRAIDVNCGCPIELVYRQGAGSALLETPSKLEKIVRGMNAVSNEVPITVKIRMGVKDNAPNADKLIQRLVLGGHEARIGGVGGSGAAAITLHGRSRQQRYTRLADWSYISECAALINRLNKETNALTDTAAEADPRNQPNGGKVYFVGNGDCYSQQDYFEHIKHAKVDSVMIARGALIKPWIFEEISSGQYLDKSGSERLDYIEKFCRYGLEAWGSDELGVGTTRRFLLEWLSFSCRYVPIGILERLPPVINERPPPFRGRDDLETLLSSGDYRDWIRIR